MYPLPILQAESGTFLLPVLCVAIVSTSRRGWVSTHPFMSPSRGLPRAGQWEGRKRGSSWFVMVKQEALPGK